MYFKFVVESRELGKVTVSKEMKNVGFGERISALASMIEALEIEKEDIPTFVAIAMLVIDGGREKITIDSAELRRQMGEGDE